MMTFSKMATAGAAMATLALAVTMATAPVRAEAGVASGQGSATSTEAARDDVMKCRRCGHPGGRKGLRGPLPGGRPIFIGIVR